SAGNAGKVKRIRNASRARVAPCDARGTVRGPWQDATARVITDANAIEGARSALRAKYGWQVALLDFVSRVTGRAKRRAWLETALSRTYTAPSRSFNARTRSRETGSSARGEPFKQIMR